MICRNCGNEIENDSLFCRNCGMKVETEKNVSTIENKLETKNEEANDEGDTNKYNNDFNESGQQISKPSMDKKKKIIIGGIVVLIVVIALLFNGIGNPIAGNWKLIEVSDGLYSLDEDDIEDIGDFMQLSVSKNTFKIKMEEGTLEGNWYIVNEDEINNDPTAEPVCAFFADGREFGVGILTDFGDGEVLWIVTEEANLMFSRK